MLLDDTLAYHAIRSRQIALVCWKNIQNLFDRFDAVPTPTELYQAALRQSWLLIQPRLMRKSDLISPFVTLCFAFAIQLMIGIAGSTQPSPATA